MTHADDDRTADRLLDLLHTALDDERVRIPAPALVRVRRRFVELAETEGYIIVRQPPTVIDLDDVGRRHDTDWDIDP